MKKSILIDYEELSVEQLSEIDQQLVCSAKEAASRAYNPYSHFFVGASVLLDNGVIVQGSNQENIAYPSGLCAERTAMFSASSQYPESKMKAICVVGGVSKNMEGKVITPKELTFCSASPCGACRQVMAEYEKKGGIKLRILLYHDDSKIQIFDGVDNLLPFIFAI